MILKLQFPSCSKGPSGTGTGWALLIVTRKKENNLNTWENNIMWSVMFLVLIRQKRKINQLLFLYDLLNKNYFQAETKKYITADCHLCASHWSTESTSINHGTGRRMKLPPSWLSLPPALHVTPSLWSLMTVFLGQASCYKCLILCRVFCFWKGQKMTASSCSHNWKEGRELPFTLEKVMKVPEALANDRKRISGQSIRYQEMSLGVIKQIREEKNVS